MIKIIYFLLSHFSRLNTYCSDTAIAQSIFGNPLMPSQTVAHSFEYLQWWQICVFQGWI